MKMELLELKERDIPLIPQFLASWIRPDIFEMTVFSCKGYADFLAGTYALPTRLRPTLLIGVYCGEELLGYAEWRFMQDTLFLNNIYVLDKCRGTGVGMELIEFGKRLASEGAYKRIALDVFDWAPKTIAWYERLGFAEKSRQHYYACGNPFSEAIAESAAGVNADGAAAADDYGSGAAIEDYPQAEAAHRRFGFSAFQLKMGDASYRVGRLGDRYFRLAVQPPVPDPALWQTLALLDKERSLLLLSGQKFADRELPAVRACGSIRMALELE